MQHKRYKTRLSYKNKMAFRRQRKSIDPESQPSARKLKSEPTEEPQTDQNDQVMHAVSVPQPTEAAESPEYNPT